MNDLFGGLAAMLVALPSAIAFGIVIYSSLGSGFTAQGATAGILGTIAVGLVASLFGGTKRLISAPCAPAAAILSVFAHETLGHGVKPDQIPFLLVLVGFLAGIFQIAGGLFKGGRFIKYVPYPVVAGYMSGVGILIFSAQLPKLLGLPGEVNMMNLIHHLSSVKWQSLLIGLVTMTVMALGHKITKKIPAAILALLSGLSTYFLLAIFDPILLVLKDNPFVIGPIVSVNFSFSSLVRTQLEGFSHCSLSDVKALLVPSLTLATLLSIDTLKTCLMLNAMTRSKSDSNRELIAQGLANMASSLFCGIPGAGTTGPTLVNLSSGGRTRLSSFLEGGFAFLVFLVLGKLLAWIPVSTLAGILIVIAARTIDRKNLTLWKRRSTLVDFIVILCVIIAALTLSLIWAAVVGIAMSVVLFLRDQIHRPVVRRRFNGSELFSKRKRIPEAREVLTTHGATTFIFELQGPLFFGTTDQLMMEIDPVLSQAKTVILEMHRVQVVDYSGAYVLKQIEARISDNGGKLVLAAVPQSGNRRNIQRYLEELGLVSGKADIEYFDSLDEALEWSEDQILKAHWDGERPLDYVLDLTEIPLFEGIHPKVTLELRKIIKTVEFKSGALIFKRHDEGSTLFFIARGTVKIVLQVPGSAPHHIATFGKGDFFGDLAFLDKEARSADALALEDTTLYSLSREDFEELSKEHPHTTALVFEQLSRMLSQRLRQTNLELEALSRA